MYTLDTGAIVLYITIRTVRQMDIPLDINPMAPMPIYRQLADQLEVAIRSGVLLAGSPLPSHRHLSSRLSVNHLTVKRAYDDLQALGLIRTQRGIGRFVAEEAITAKGIPRVVSEHLRTAVENAQIAGIAREQIMDEVNRLWKERMEGHR